MTTRKLKWVGLGDSEYVSREGAFLVQLRDRTWHLHSRVIIDVAGLPSWTWSASLFSDKRKGACQDEAENPSLQTVEASLAADEASKHATTAEPEGDGDDSSDGRGTKRALGPGYGRGGDEHSNAHCYDCGVAFQRGPKWQYGDLCGEGCMDTMVDVLSEVKALG